MVTKHIGILLHKSHAKIKRPSFIKFKARQPRHDITKELSCFKKIPIMLVKERESALETKTDKPKKGNEKIIK